MKNLLDDIKYYNPYYLKNLRLRKHLTTNGAEGEFGNLKKWTDHKMQPLDKILELFVNECRMLIKKHINLKYNQLDISVYNGRKLGMYTVNKIQKRIQKCKDLIVASKDKNEEISSYAINKLNNCNCVKNDLPCIHIIFERLINSSKFENIIYENEIPEIYFFNNFSETPPEINEKIIVEDNKEEIWDYNSTMEKFKYWADVAQRSEPARNLIKEFFINGQKLKKTIDPMERDVLVTQGAQPTVPSANVCQHFRKKRSPCCSNCHKRGHYASTCPFKHNNESST